MPMMAVPARKIEDVSSGGWTVRYDRRILSELPMQSQPGAFLFDEAPIEDHRGSFARAFSQREFAQAGLSSQVVQSNLTRSTHAGVVRGLHNQRSPTDERKFVRCIVGSVFDAIVDMRPGSPTHLRARWVELDAVDRRSLLIPAGVAHGYQSLTDGADILYLTDRIHRPELETGVRFDDQAFSIPWPLPAPDPTERDRNWPLLASHSEPG
jgi:dTDP-4-dehydrorhamnose 3,5-epimerase